MSDPTQDIFELVLARPVMTATGEDPQLVHLWWRAEQQDERLVQVYVNDELYDVSTHAAQRDMMLALDRTDSHRIELLAVSADAAWRDHAHHLAAWQPRVGDVLTLRLLRDERLPVDTQISVQVNDVELDRGALWPADEHRSGFGALFGEGGFGIDAATGPGLGGGELGAGPLGADGTAWRWRQAQLPAGSHDVALHATTGTGEPTGSDSAAVSVTLDRLAEPTTPRVDTDFVLHW